jgi:SH3-like domain-containing protein
MVWVLIVLVIVAGVGGALFYLRRRQSESDIPLPDIGEPVDYTSMDTDDMDEPQNFLERISSIRERFDEIPLPAKIGLFASPILVIVLVLLFTIGRPILFPPPPPPTPPPPPERNIEISKADLVSESSIRIEATTNMTNGIEVEAQLLADGEPFMWYSPAEARTQVQTGTISLRMNRVLQAPVPKQDQNLQVRLSATSEFGQSVQATQQLNVPDPLVAQFYRLENPSSPGQAAGNQPANAGGNGNGGGNGEEASEPPTPEPVPSPEEVADTPTPDIPELEPAAEETPPDAAVTEEPVPDEAATEEVAPPSEVLPVAAVAHGGNVRAIPGGEPILDQVQAGEEVTLIQQAADGEWYQLRNERDVVGWVHYTLLTIDPDVAAQIPVEGTTDAPTEPVAEGEPTTPPEPTQAPAVEPTPTAGEPAPEAGTEETAQPAATGLTATVFNGGNVRQTPGGEPILDQINANETVALLQKTPDSTWYQIRNERNIVGWVHHTLLTIDPNVAAQVPVAEE